VTDAGMPLLMFCCVFLLVFSGYPVAFVLGGVSLVFAALGVELGWFPAPYLSGIFDRTYGILSNPVLLAVPTFIFMGTMLEKSRLAEGLLTTIGQLFGPLRGGLALAVVFVGALLAAATGVVGASVVAMGSISLPVMLRYGYPKELATGVIAASGTLGQIIPPSVVLVVLADQIGTSVGDLFLGALVPGLALAALFSVYIGAVAILRPASAPALPLADRGLSGRQLARRVATSLLPPLALIVVVLGSIFFGIATPTEAGALGALGATGLCILSGTFSVACLRETAQTTLRLTCMVMFLLVGSTVFAHVFRGYSGDVMVENLLVALPGGFIGALIFSNLLIFALGFFIDFFEICFIVVPLIAPVFLREYGVHPAWFGVMIAMNLQTSFLTPPFGFSLFYLKGVCPPEVRTGHLYRGAVPFIAIQLVALLVVIIFPETVTWHLR